MILQLLLLASTATAPQGPYIGAQPDPIVHFEAAAIPRKKKNFTGEWATQLGPMKLKQKGKKVTGTGGFDNKIKINGKVKGKKLTFEAKGGARGEGTLELWKGGDQFSGEFTTKGGDSGPWRAYRIDPKMPKPKPGKIVSGQSHSWLNFHLRVPKKYNGKREYPAIAFFHGSNMTSADYVHTIAAAWPKLAEDYILVGFDGEKLSPAAKAGRLAYNFTYINFSGPERGPKWVHRQSPALVADALQELGATLPITQWIIGGHSQGGFLSYAVAMYYPELIVGAFPMSCNLLVQCEPDNFEGKRREQQLQLAWAPIHGENDGVVEFSGGQYCYARLIDGEFPRVKFFTDPHAAHMFARLPVEQAVRWIEKVTSPDVQELVEYGAECVESEDYRSATAVLARARELGNARSEDIDELEKQIDAVAAEPAAELASAIKADKNNEWVPTFLEFRRKFAFAGAAESTMKAYGKLRKKHQKSADALFSRARGANRSTRNKFYQEIIDDYYASSWYEHVVEWIQ